MTLFYPVENRKRKQKTIDVVRTFPPQILIHNTSRLTYLDNSQDHLSLPRMKLGLIGLITLFRDASSPTPIVNNHIYITWKISKQLYLKSKPHSRDCIPLQRNSFWVLLGMMKSSLSKWALQTRWSFCISVLIGVSMSIFRTISHWSTRDRSLYRNGSLWKVSGV